MGSLWNESGKGHETSDREGWHGGMALSGAAGPGPGLYEGGTDYLSEAQRCRHGIPQL